MVPRISQDLLWRTVFLLGGKVGIWKQARELPLSGAEEQAALAISAHAQCACLLSLQMGSIN
jgi:hypothetical protein